MSLRPVSYPRLGFQCVKISPEVNDFHFLLIKATLSTKPDSTPTLQERSIHNSVSRSSFSGKKVFIETFESKRIEFLGNLFLRH